MMQALSEWEAREKERQDAYAGVAGGIDASANPAADAPQFVAYVPLPDQKEIEQRVRAALAPVTTALLSPGANARINGECLPRARWASATTPSRSCLLSILRLAQRD